ncbi:MAG: type VI secretion system baseplate subunit TssE [Gemmatimonadaceae bacterium]|jgi:type VI secretion system protein ImpF|nr:type VI secretion system baseplate subunit TssE [Gemmatimonadaceae bacterium]
MRGADDTGEWRTTAQHEAARRDAGARPVQTSLLDRLTDDAPGIAREALPTRADSVRALRDAVRHDLEWLLNTRRELVLLADEMTELRRSLIRYGVPDVSSMSRDGTDTVPRLVREVEEAIAIFEPRLAQARVVALHDPGVSARQELRFTIEALLRIDPAPERVVFDTVLEASRGDYRLRGGGGDA